MTQNVQTLLKLGANPNSQDIDGNSCLHLCIKQIIEIRVRSKQREEQGVAEKDEEELNTEGFEILKNIAKELLFSGCDRDLRNDDGLTARDIFQQNL